MSELGLGRVKTQRRANCKEKYPFGSLLWEREQHTELRRRGIGEAGSLPFARFHVFTQPGSLAEPTTRLRQFRSARENRRCPSCSSCSRCAICGHSQITRYGSR